MRCCCVQRSQHDLMPPKIFSQFPVASKKCFFISKKSLHSESLHKSLWRGNDEIVASLGFLSFLFCFFFPQSSPHWEPRTITSPSALTVLLFCFVCFPVSTVKLEWLFSRTSIFFCSRFPFIVIQGREGVAQRCVCVRVHVCICVQVSEKFYKI